MGSEMCIRDRSGLGVQRMLCASFAKEATGGDSIMNTFGAPLPPVELAIDAERIEVATDGFNGEHEVTAVAVRVVQQLRGSAPYMDLHRDSSMVVHLC